MYCCCSVAQLFPTLCDPMDCTLPSFPVLHHLPEFTQTDDHRVRDAIQPSHPLSSPSPPALNLSQHQDLSNESALRIKCQRIGASASVSVLPMNIQDWFPLGLAGLISLLFKGLLKRINSSMLSLLYGPTLMYIHDYWKNHSFDYTDICWQSNVSAFNMVNRFKWLNMVSRLVLAFLLRNKCLLISWLQSPSVVILEPKKIKSVTVSIVFPWSDRTGCRDLHFLNVEF